MLESQLLDGHLKQLSVHRSLVELLPALGAFVSVSIVGVLVVGFQAFFAEDDIALVALEWMDDDVFADNAV